MTTDVVEPLTQTLFASVLTGIGVSAVFFPTPSSELSDKAEGGRTTVGVLKMDVSRLREGASVLPAVP
jgi:hypothetical protein